MTETIGGPFEEIENSNITFLKFKMKYIKNLKKLKKSNYILVIVSTMFIIGYIVKLFVSFDWFDIFIIGIWIFNFVYNLKGIKNKRKNIKKAYDEYYTILKEHFPEKYMKIMRTNKLKKIC